MADGSGFDLSSSQMETEVKNALTALHDALDTKNTETANKVEDFLNKYEDAKKEHDKALREAEEKTKASEDRIKDLETALATKGKDYKVSERDTKTYNGFMSWVQKGESAVDRDDLVKSILDELSLKSTLRTDIDTQGGFLLPKVVDNELRKNIREVSPVRFFARQRVMPSKTIEIPRRGTPITRAPFEGETEQDDTGISKYVNEQVTAFRQSWTVPVTKDMLISSAFDLENEIMSDVMEAFADGEGYEFLHGTGSKGPKGIISDTRCEVVSTASSGVLAFEDFATIIGKLKKGQRPAFFMNRVTLSEIWKLKGSDGHPIWSPVPAGGQTPATIFGYPYNSDMINLDNHVPTTSNTKPVIFGDLSRGYEVFDLTGVEVIRDDVTKKRQAIIEMTFHRYLTGQPILPEAIKILQIQ